MTKRIWADCRFHGIGQGLFYSGSIHKQVTSDCDFNFIYDCGTLYAKDNCFLEREIDDCFQNGHPRHKPTVHALFLSHLHRDHISGVPYLLKNYCVKNVFLPYFTPEELFLFASDTDISDVELRTLYTDPIEYFTGKNCRVFLVHPIQTDREDRESPNNEPYPFTEQAGIFIEGNVVRNTESSTLNEVYDVWGGLSICAYRYDWRFSIYQDQTEREQESIRTKIEHAFIKNKISPILPGGQLDVAALDQVWSDSSLCKNIKALYSSVKSGINQSSLVLYHEPTTETLMSVSGEYCPICPGCCDRRSLLAGTLLTGDIDLHFLRDEGKAFEKFIEDSLRFNTIGILQLPHHGSGHNVCVNQIKKIIYAHMAYLVCSYGFRNRFRHPDPFILDELMRKCHTKIAHVVANRDFDYQIVSV